jgi:EEF1A N-terminal glycine/lysine methyltransferase
LEFGAGAGLPSLACAIHGARKVVVTDYPDQDLVENLRYNIEHCAAPLHNITAQGYLWGNSPSTLLTSHPSSPTTTTTPTISNDRAFDLLILADLLFNHSEHRKLVLSIELTLKRNPTARALVFFTPHRPWLFEKDMAFFRLAREMGFCVDKVLEKTMEKAMVAEGPARRSINDCGDEPVKKVVFGYELRRAS